MFAVAKNESGDSFTQQLPVLDVHSAIPQVNNVSLSHTFCCVQRSPKFVTCSVYSLLRFFLFFGPAMVMLVITPFVTLFGWSGEA